MRSQVDKARPDSRQGRAGRSLRWALVPLVMGIAAGTAQAQRGDGSFDCQVETDLGVQGLVMVQTDAIDTARRIAVGGMAVTMDNREARSISVIQCVKRGEKRFTDLEFRRFAENLPR